MSARAIPLLQRSGPAHGRLSTDTAPWPVMPDLQEAPRGATRSSALSPALVVAGDEATGHRWERIVSSASEGAEVTIVSSFAEACAAIACMAFAVMVVDMEVPDGLELIARARHNQAQMPALAIAPFDRNDTVMTALHAGASGYVIKEREDVELVLSLKSLQRGGTPIDPNAVRWIISLLPRSPHSGANADGVRLSARELEVLQLLARGFSNRDIAELISLSRLTVEGYIKSLYRKLGVGSRTAAVFEAQRLRLLA